MWWELDLAVLQNDGLYPYSEPLRLGILGTRSNSLSDCNISTEGYSDYNLRAITKNTVLTRIPDVTPLKSMK